MNDLVPREKLVKQGMRGLGGIAGGAGLFVLRLFTGGVLIHLPLNLTLSLSGLVAGGLVTLVGLAIGASREDRRAGLAVAAAGLLTLAASLPLVGGLGSRLMGIGAVGLLAFGVVNLLRFLRNLRRRM